MRPAAADTVRQAASRASSFRRRRADERDGLAAIRRTRCPFSAGDAADWCWNVDAHRIRASADRSSGSGLAGCGSFGISRMLSKLFSETSVSR